MRKRERESEGKVYMTKNKYRVRVAMGEFDVINKSGLRSSAHECVHDLHTRFCWFNALFHAATGLALALALTIYNS